MKHSFTAVAAAFVLCVTVMFSGCREGGHEVSSGYSAGESVEELDFGERSGFSSVSSHISSVYSSSAISSGPVESHSSTTVSESVSSSIPISAQTSVSSSVSTSSSSDAPIVVIVSSQSSSYESSVQSSSVPIAVVVPEQPVQSSSSGESDTSGDTSEDQSAVPAVPDDTSAMLPEESSDGSLSEPETSVSPYDYEGTVYVAASGNGTRYHKNPNCSNMKGAVGMDVRDALVKGYTPCKKCW